MTKDLHPDWRRVMGVVGHDANELLPVTRYTAELAMAALHEKNAADLNAYATTYQNSGLAERELTDVLNAHVECCDCRWRGIVFLFALLLIMLITVI